ncbi:MAG: stage V sporulation protein S [Caldilineae bacterium]|nr:MAG: stage V sporulation protein S [Caldilineae bacterium]
MAVILRVASATDVRAVAGAIAGMIREEGRAEVQAIGPQAVNQAVKGAAIARTFLAPEALDVAFIPQFVEVEVEGRLRTALRLTVVAWSR